LENFMNLISLFCSFCNIWCHTVYMACITRGFYLFMFLDIDLAFPGVRMCVLFALSRDLFSCFHVTLLRYWRISIKDPYEARH